MAETAQARVDVARAIRDALIAGLVAFGILLPLIGLRTAVNIRNELILEPRPVLLAVMVAFVVAIEPADVAGGAAAVAAARRGAARGRKRQGRANGARQSRNTSCRSRSASHFSIRSFAILFAGMQGSVKWIDNFGIQILIYIMLGWGLNIVVGLAGLLDLGYVAFYAVGAYSYALLAKSFGFSFWILLPLSGILAAFWGILLGFPVLRLRGDYLAIVTLAFGEIIRLVLINWVDLTNGYAGISGIPRPTFFGIPFNANEDGFAAVFGLEFSPIYRTIFLYYVILCLVAADRLRDDAAAAAADRARLGSLARGRDRLPRARHRHHQDQALRLRDRRDVRRLCRLVLRRAPGIHLAGILHLHGIGDDPRHRRARRHGQPARRGDRRHRHDRRHRIPARTRFPEKRIRQSVRSDAIPHAAVRRRAWC